MISDYRAMWDCVMVADNWAFYKALYYYGKLLTHSQAGTHTHYIQKSLQAHSADISVWVMHATSKGFELNILNWIVTH